MASRCAGAIPVSICMPPIPSLPSAGETAGTWWFLLRSPCNAAGPGNNPSL